MRQRSVDKNLQTVNKTRSDAKWNEPKPDTSNDRAQRLMRRLSRRVNVFVRHRARHKIYV